MPTEKTMTTSDAGEVQAIHSATLSGDGVPSRVLIARWGLVESTSGSFVLDDESARRAVEAFETHGTDLPIDYEHQTLEQALSTCRVRSLVASGRLWSCDTRQQRQARLPERMPRPAAGRRRPAGSNGWWPSRAWACSPRSNGPTTRRRCWPPRSTGISRPSRSSARPTASLQTRHRTRPLGLKVVWISAMIAP